MRIAIITGASGGIGKEFAKAMKERYPEIEEYWLVARNRERLEALRDELSVNSKILALDLSVREGIDEIKQRLEEEKPTVKYLINAAGFGKFGGFDEVPLEYAESMIDLNVKALVSLTYITVPYMERGGRIIQLGSGSCFTPLPYFNVYSSSKVFVLHFTKSLNYELKDYGVRATCFCPGWVETEFLGRAASLGEVTHPKKTKPLLSADKIVKGCLRAMDRGKAMYVTNWYTKLQHLLFKMLPDKLLTRAWLGMLEYPKSKTEKEKR